MKRAHVLMQELQWEALLNKQKGDGLLRRLHHEEGEPFLDFTHNDYLCLSRHPGVVEGAIKAIQQYGAGRCSSRLIGGGYSLLDQFETELAGWYGKQRALLFPSGYQANTALLSTILNSSSLVIADKYIHRSIIEGIKHSGAKLLRYPHGDLEAMRKLLLKYHTAFSLIICVTESVFSMHGTVIDIDAFCALAADFGALSCVDDAHGFGVMKQDERKRLSSCDIVVTTLSKGLGVQGGAVLGSTSLVEYLVNFAPGFIYTTSLSPGIVGGGLAAFRLLPSLHKERAHLWSLIELFSQGRKQLDLQKGVFPTCIQPIYVGEAQRASHIQEMLKQRGILAVAIRSPTVPMHQAIIRFSLSSAHTEASLGFLFKTLQGLLV